MGAPLVQINAKNEAVAGIDINVVREPNDSYWDNVWLKKPWCMCYWGGRPVADMFLSNSLSDSAPRNDTHWKNPRFNETDNLLTGATDQLSVRV